MTRIKLDYVHEFVDRHGVVRRYFRRRGFKQVPLPGVPGSDQFMAAYQAALDSAPMPVGAKRNKPGSLSAAIAAYYLSPEFLKGLADDTQYMRRTILERFRREHGDKSISTLPAQFIAMALRKMSPNVARNWLKAVRGLCRFCVAQGMLRTDPTRDLKPPRAKKTDGRHTWSESEIATFESHHPIGSMSRLAFALLLYTAQRRGDVIRMGRQHIAGDILFVRQRKTGKPLRVPIHPALQAALDAAPGTNMTLLTTPSGRPFRPNGFNDDFREWCNEAGLPQECTPHGLRKAACRRLAEAGCSVHEIAAISGHASLQEVQRYTKDAEQERMARSALARMGTQNVQTSGKPEPSEVATLLNSLTNSTKR
jgi:integrase